MLASSAIAVRARPRRRCDPAPCRAPPSGSSSAIVERVLVRVNGEIFTQSQLTNRQIEALRELQPRRRPKLEARLAEVTPAFS